MKIERYGICRECSEREYENKFKQQGYELVEELEGLKKEYTVEELRALAKDNKIKNYWSKKEENLIEELKKVGVL